MNFWPFVATIALAAETTIFPFFGDSTIASHPLQPSITFGTLSTNTTIKPTVSPPIQKKHYTIAILGDSMVDTLGTNVPELAGGLTAFFPNATFSLFNYGVGATNIDYGIQRLTNSYVYKEQNIPSLVSRNPNIVIVESFGYNPYPNGTKELMRYKEQLTNLLHILKTNLPHAEIVLAVTIAPNNKMFGDGAPGIAFSPEEKNNRTTIIKQYLQAAVVFARNNHILLADAYTASLDSEGNGNPLYISSTDHIHYSPIGRLLFTQKIIEAIQTNHLVQ